MQSPDAGIRSRLGAVEAFDFGDTPFVTPKPLSESRVAIVTTAGLRTDGGATWAANDQSFTVLDRSARNLTVAHVSTGFDRSGFAADINVAYPIDRLEELAAVGVIGSVAARHYSFMGAQLDHTMTTLRLDTGPLVAKMLADDGVDVVLLTPV